MARSAKMSKEQAIRSAINAFWRYGYSAMGVRRLEEETGINRFMLQTVFGGKGGIFFLVLDEYTLLFKNLLLDPLAKGDISNVQEFFELRTTDNSFTKPEYGCLIINTLLSPLVIKYLFGQDYQRAIVFIPWISFKMHLTHQK